MPEPIPWNRSGPHGVQIALGSRGPLKSSMEWLKNRQDTATTAWYFAYFVNHSIDDSSGSPS
jgi:hypothetical protein